MDSKFVGLVVFAIATQSLFALAFANSIKNRASHEAVYDELQDLRTIAHREYEHGVNILFGTFLNELDNISLGNKCVVRSDKSTIEVSTDKDRSLVHFNNGMTAVLHGITSAICPEASSAVEDLVDKIKCKYRYDTLGVIYDGFEMIENTLSPETQAILENIESEGQKNARIIVESALDLIRNCSSGLPAKTKAAVINSAGSKAIFDTSTLYRTPFRAIEAIINTQLPKSQSTIEDSIDAIKCAQKTASHHFVVLIDTFFGLYETIYRLSDCGKSA